MRRTILLADDSVTVRKIVELTFSDTDIRVCAVASGQEALDRLSDLRPDLVLADVVMPGLSGYELCRAIKTSARPVPVLLLAGTFEPFDAQQARECGSDGHVTKPFDSRELVLRVEQLVAHPEPQPVRNETAVHAPDDELEAMFDALAAPASRRGSEHDMPPLALEADGIRERDAAASPASALPNASSGTPTLTPADLDAIARLVVERLSERILREIAWDVVPDLAEIIVRERIRELERDEHEPG
jgi:CheY-like chemotaxis protein